MRPAITQDPVWSLVGVISGALKASGHTVRTTVQTIDRLARSTAITQDRSGLPTTERSPQKRIVALHIRQVIGNIRDEYVPAVDRRRTVVKVGIGDIGFCCGVAEIAAVGDVRVRQRLRPGVRKLSIQRLDMGT